MKNMRPKFHSTRTPAASLASFFALFIALVIAGCAVTPQPLKTEDVRKRYAADQYLLYAEQEPITAPIDVNTAIARALKYNLDYRLKLMERALATGLWEVSRYDMLPKIVTSAGYAWRNNDSGGTSVSIIDGRETLSPSTSQERNRWLANAEFSWNLLDFGVSYYRAKQLADETLISEERRRRVIQNIVQDTRSAYWRAVGAQRLAKKADDLLARVKTALAKSRQAEKLGLLPPVQALSYQRELLDATTQLNIRRQELEFSKRELAALMNVTPGTNFTLADEKEPELPQPPRNIGELEEVALENRPELREEDYRRRISVAETRKALLSLLPGISFDFAGRYDSNKYLYNQAWIDGGVQIFANLMRLLSYPAVKKSNEARIAADDARRVALSMAVITQVRVAIQRYELSLVDLDLAEQATQVDGRLAKYARVAMTMRVDSELELVRSEARALIGEFQRYSSYANAQAAYGRILNSLGVDLLPEKVESADVNSLAVAVAGQIEQAARDTFPVALAPVERELPTIRVQIENVKNPRLKRAAEEAAVRVLRSAGYTVSQNDPKAWMLHMRFHVAGAGGGVSRGVWHIRLDRADGTLAGSSEYSSALTAQFRPSTMDAFTDAATASQLHMLHGWLSDAASPLGARIAEAEVQQSEALSEPSPKKLQADAAALQKPVEAWAQAWAAQDVEHYLGAYAPGFKPADGRSRKAWEKLRKARIAKPDNIRVSISELQVLQRTDGRAEVTFRQDYRSDRYQDSVRKRLELVRQGERWLIADERVVATLAGPDVEPASAVASVRMDEEKSGDQGTVAAVVVQQEESNRAQQNFENSEHQNLIARTQAVGEVQVPERGVQVQAQASADKHDAVAHKEGVAESVEVIVATQHEQTAAVMEPDADQLQEPVMAWAQAWAAQDLERYLGAYAPGFEPADGRSRRAWETLRRQRVTNPERIQVSVSEMRVLRRSNRQAEVIFRQDYRSDRYQDSVRKRLNLVRDGERWLIAGERVVATMAGSKEQPAYGVATAWIYGKQSHHKARNAAAGVAQKSAEGTDPNRNSESHDAVMQQGTAGSVSKPVAAAIRKPVETWAQAWAAQDLDGYLAAYAPGFKPADGRSRKAWEGLRRSRVSEPSNIRLSISDMRVLRRNDERADLLFRQDYRSDRYQDSVRKRLELVRVGERWLIAEEHVVAILAGPGSDSGPKTASRGHRKQAKPVAAVLRTPVELWAQAWADQDVERYLGAYAPGFRPPQGNSREEWEMLRRERVTEPKNIQVSVSEMNVLRRNDGRAAVTFRQDYRSDRYQDSVRKRLELVQDGERWLIAEERVVATLAGPGAGSASGPATAWLEKERSTGGSLTGPSHGARDGEDRAPELRSEMGADDSGIGQPLTQNPGRDAGPVAIRG